MSANAESLRQPRPEKFLEGVDDDVPVVDEVGELV
jgi:hypothetical protein